MDEPQIDEGLLALLRKVDTPTVCNAIEVAQGKRGFNNYTHKTMLSSAPEDPAVVGLLALLKLQVKSLLRYRQKKSKSVEWITFVR